MTRSTFVLPNLLASFFVLFALSSPVNAAVFCVDSATALHSALSTAETNRADNEIRIVQGTYVGNFVYDGPYGAALSIRGGYSKGCAGRDVNPSNTILDGNRTGRVLIVSFGDESRFVVEGLTLRNGKATSGVGGGLALEGFGRSCVVTLDRNHIEQNESSSHGGGAYIRGNGVITVSNSRIYGNSTSQDDVRTAASGGGIWMTTSGSVAITNNSIYNNAVYSSSQSGDEAGGIRVLNGDGPITFTNNHIYDNTFTSKGDGMSHAGGASVIISANNTSTATVSHNLISGNSAVNAYCGGLYVSAQEGAATVSENMIQDNFASLDGGGVCLFAKRAWLSHNTIEDNRSDRLGGGANVGTLWGAVTITNNSIHRNTASEGGGAYVRGDSWSESFTLTNNSIVDNTASSGGGLLLDSSYAKSAIPIALYNNLFWKNHAHDLVGADFKVENDPNEGDSPTLLILRANNFNQAIGSGFDVKTPIPIDASNLNAVDPLFVDAETGDLSLLPGSPMIDAGYPGTPNLPPTDITGEPRVIGGVVDIGAYEYDDGFIPSALLNSAVLPYARAVAIGETATAFASIINSGNATATDCSLALPEGTPAPFSYQTTNAANALIGNPDTPVDILPGATQGFVFGITPSQAMAATEIPLVFNCTNTAPAPSHSGLNTFILSAAASAPPDLLAIGATPSGDGVVRLPNRDGTGFFATAAVNIGSPGTVTVSADDGGRGLPLSLRVCETTPAGEWIVCGNNLTRSVNSGQTAYYTIFATGTGQPIALDPANNRLFLRFAANGTTVGATNVAVMVP